MTTAHQSAEIDPSLSAHYVKEKLAAGVSAQDILDEVIKKALPATRYGLSLLGPWVRILVADGARVATEDDACAYARLLRQPFPRGGVALASAILPSLLEAPGEIPVHRLARDCPTILLSNLSAGAKDDFLASARKLDARGRNVSHWLWDQAGLLVEHANLPTAAAPLIPALENNMASAALAGARQAAAHKAAKKVWLDTVHQAWKIQHTLGFLGIGMDQPDHDGITAMDLCIDRINAGHAHLVPGYSICDHVKAVQESRAMHAATPGAASSRLTPRL